MLGVPIKKPDAAYFSNRLGYLKPAEYDNLRNNFDKLGKLLWKFYEAIGGK
jgi:hypothetical protein